MVSDDTVTTVNVSGGIPFGKKIFNQVHVRINKVYLQKSKKGNLLKHFICYIKCAKKVFLSCNVLFSKCLLQFSTNGLVTFESRVYTYTPPSTPQTYHLLAPYWTDLYPLGSNGGYVYYRVSGQSDIDKASHDVRTFANIPSFQAKWVLVVTWSTTPFFPKADGPVSKFSSIKTFKHKNEICSRLHVCRKLVQF